MIHAALTQGLSPAGLPRRGARVGRAALGGRRRMLLRPGARAPVPGARGARRGAPEPAGLPGAGAAALPARRRRRALLAAAQGEPRDGD